MGLEDAPRFVKAHAEEIEPLVQDDAHSQWILQHLESSDGVPEDIQDNPEQLRPILRAYENKLYSFDKIVSGSNPDGRRVFFTMNDPLSYTTLSPIIRNLLSDPRASGVSALTSGYASKFLERDFSDAHIAEVRDPEHMIIEDVIEHTEQTHPDVVIGTASSLNGPESLALFAGKSSLEARKLYFYFEGWGTAGSSFPSSPSEIDKIDRMKRMDLIDQFLVVDEVGKKILMHEIPSIPEEKIKIVGSPVIDAIRVADSVAYTHTAREKLGLSPEEIALLYLGDVSHDYNAIGFETDPEINEKTFDKTLRAVIETAKRTPERKYVLLVRPHPRDPHKYRLLSEVTNSSVPPNLTIKAADNSVTSMQEARYAADAVFSIGSTENFLAPRIGRKAVFLRYADEPGLGAVVGDRTYGSSLEKDISDAEPKIAFIRSSEEAGHAIEALGRAPEKVPKASEERVAIDTISNLIFNDD